MLELVNLLRWMLLDLFRSRSSLEAEIIALRQQVNVLRRSAPKRPALSMFDRFIFVCAVPARAEHSRMRSQSFALRRLCAGIALAFAPFGAGSRDHVPAGPRCHPKFGG